MAPTYADIGNEIAQKVIVSKELLARYEQEANVFISRIVTGNER